MKRIIALLGLAFCIQALYSQTALNFCTYVEQNGNCIFNNNKFITSPDSTTGRIFMKVNSAGALGAKLTYKIFSVGKNAEEKLVQSIDQNIQAEWIMAWEPFILPTNTKYNVKVYNDGNLVICTKGFELVGSK